MKTLGQWFTFALLFSVTIMGAQKSAPQSSTEEQAVSQLERELAKAYIQGDAKTLARILADELIDTSDGLVVNKQYHLKYLNPRNGLTAELSNMKVRVYGNAAVVTGVEVLIEAANKDNAIYYRFTDTFLKREVGWQLIATQRQTVPVWNTRYMEISELKVLTVQNCSQESSLRSLSYDTPAYIRFFNATSQPVVVYWLNYEGKRDPSEEQKETLKPGQSGFRSTYLTHPFLVSDVTGKCLGIYQSAPEPSLAVIK
jgi:ketosteroid isomerase-like protein